MKRTVRLLALLSLVFPFLIFSSSVTVAAQTNGNLPEPPIAKKIPKPMTIHGETRADDYFWLREKANGEVISYLEAENAYADAVMKPTAEFQRALNQEMLSHIKQTDVNVPTRIGEYFYYTRTEEGKQYPIFARRRKSLDAPEEITLDMNELASGHKFFSVGAYSVSDDGHLLAYSTDTTGYRQYTLHVKDLRTGRLLPDRAERVLNVSWARDNKTIFYVTEDAVTKRSDKFFRHVLGTEKHEQIYHEPDEQYSVGSYRTRDKAFIFVTSESKTTSEAQYLPADRPTESLRVLLPREIDHEYDVDHRGGLFYIRTNQGGKNFRLVTAPVNDPQKKNWKEIVPHRKDVKLDGVNLFANHMQVTELEGGSQKMRIVDLRTGKSTPIKFPEPVYAVFGGGNPEFDTNTFRYNYQSLVTPNSVYDLDMNTQQSKLMKRTEVPNYDSSLYTSERVYATASDGTRVPVSLVHKKGVKRDGTAPMHLYAYGSYGSSSWPTFNSNRLVLLDRGVTYAVAHIRGGGEIGEPWRDAGRMMNKKNTFTDFIAVADHLVKEKYTSPDRLVISGGSAGGLLMGAVVNMRPDLFKAVVSYVPFVDVINTMLDATIPLTAVEYLEWGNPNEKAAYEYMKSYDPYGNLAAKEYPTILVRASLNDSQVPYWEAAKYVAKMRTLKKDRNLLLMRTNMGAGHGGASGRYDALRDLAYDYAFMLNQVGITK